MSERDEDEESGRDDGSVVLKAPPKIHVEDFDYWPAELGASTCSGCKAERVPTVEIATWGYSFVVGNSGDEEGGGSASFCSACLRALASELDDRFPPKKGAPTT